MRPARRWGWQTPYHAPDGARKRWHRRYEHHLGDAKPVVGAWYGVWRDDDNPIGSVIVERILPDYKATSHLCHSDIGSDSAAIGDTQLSRPNTTGAPMTFDDTRLSQPAISPKIERGTTPLNVHRTSGSLLGSLQTRRS